MLMQHHGKFARKERKGKRTKKEEKEEKERELTKGRIYVTYLQST